MSNSPKTWTHASVSSKTERPHLYTSANHKVKLPPSGKGLEDGSSPKSSSLPISHRAYPGTTKHCDLVWLTQICHHVELTVPWVEKMEEACESRKLCYENLCIKCEDKGWACQLMPIEVGFDGFIGLSTTRLGLTTNRARWRATQQLQSGVERASSWIWSKVRKSTITCDKTALLPLTPSSPPSPYPSCTPSPSSPSPLPFPIPSSAYRASHSTCSPMASPDGWSCWRR